MKKTIKDIQIGDEILGTDGKYHKVINKTPIIIPTHMYKITFSNGYVKCSDTHQWHIFINDKEYLIDSMGIFKEFDFYKNKHIGTIDGPTIVSIEEIEPEPTQCITVDNNDHQFAIYTFND